MINRNTTDLKKHRVPADKIFEQGCRKMQRKHRVPADEIFDSRLWKTSKNRVHDIVTADEGMIPYGGQKG